MAHSLHPEPIRTPQALNKDHERIFKKLAQGLTLDEALKKLAKKHGWHSRKVYRLKRQVYKLAATQAQLQEEIALEARGQMVLGLPDATQALVRRASRGRMDAIKTLYEATGFHNPKVQHEHSGEIKIKVEGVKRPEPVVDAEVVED